MSSVHILLGGKKFGKNGIRFPTSSACFIQSLNFLCDWEEWHRVLENTRHRILKTQNTKQFQQAFGRGNPNNPIQTAQALISTARWTLDGVQTELYVNNEDMQKPWCVSFLWEPEIFLFFLSGRLLDSILALVTFQGGHRYMLFI